VFNHPEFVLTIAADRRVALERQLELLRLRRDAAPTRPRRRLPRFRARPSDVAAVAPVAR